MIGMILFREKASIRHTKRDGRLVVVLAVKETVRKLSLDDHFRQGIVVQTDSHAMLLGIRVVDCHTCGGMVAVVVFIAGKQEHPLSPLAEFLHLREKVIAHLAPKAMASSPTCDRALGELVGWLTLIALMCSASERCP